jgi:hypothetical protein
VTAYKIRVRERIDSSPPPNHRQCWIEYQVVSGRKIVARFSTMKEAEKFVADSIGGENV